MSWIEQALSQYGYAAIFFLLAAGIVGPLIPDETILVISGILIHRGTLGAVPAVLCACAGSLCGITVSYELGKRGAAIALRKMAGRHMDKAHEWFARYGRWTLFFGYFVAGVRHFTALIAGSTELRYREFATFAYPGGIVWVFTFISIGYFVGDQWSRLERMIRDVGLIAAGVVLVAALTWWALRKRHAK
jgi:membrane protein DedA with SNARE-associated domain